MLPVMSLCINPRCPQPDHPDNSLNRYCAGCGSDLLLKGRLRVMRLLSSHSGFGCVYEAYEQNVPKILKVLKDIHSGNPKVLELFKREAMVLSRLNHPGVPRVDVDAYFPYFPQGAETSVHCLEMEKIDGPNLKQWMVQQGNHPIQEDQALLWLTQLVDVLHLVHQQNYFHRDIKPENIMLRSMGQLVLVDFGAVREMTDTYVAHLGASGITTISSAGYTPPEQEQGLAVPQSDFYALGRTVIYLLTAKSPNDPDIYDSRTNTFNWRQHASQVSPAFAKLIDSMISPRAMDRPQTTDELLKQLAMVKAAPKGLSSPLKAWPKTTLSISSNSASTLLQTNSSVKEKLRLRKKGAWLAVGMALMLLGGAGGLAWLLKKPSMLQLSDGQEAPDGPAARAHHQTVSTLKTLPGHRGSIDAMLLLAGGDLLLTGSADATIRLWNLTNRAQIAQLEGHTSFVKDLELSADQTRLFSAGADRQIVVWDLINRKVIDAIPDAHDTIINAIDVSPDGRTLVSASAGGDIKLWDVASGELIRTLDGDDGPINDVIFDHSGQRIASAGQSLRLWDAKTEKLVKEIYKSSGFINRVVINSANQILLSVAADGMVRVWDLDTGDLIASKVGHDGPVNELIISRDGQTFLTAGADRTVRLWDMKTYEQTLVMTGFKSDIYRFQVRFAVDQIITVGGEDHTVKVWQAPNL